MKIIKEGKPIVTVITCESCNAQLEIEPKDAYLNYNPDYAMGNPKSCFALKCPCCNATIMFGYKGLPNGFSEKIPRKK